MAHIRKRVLPSGKLRWQVIWKIGDQRATEMFETQRAAREKQIAVEGSKPSSTAPFRTLAETYLDHERVLVDTGQHEKTYLKMLEGHVNNHILADKEFADLRCCSIGTPECQQFFDRLIGRVSAKMAVKVRTTVSQIFGYGARTGFVGSNPTRDARITVKKRPESGAEASFELPSKDQLRSLLAGAPNFDNTGQAVAIVRTLMFGGLRISELRGLDRKNARLVGERPALDVVQRADRYGVIGSVKSAAGRRTVDLGPETAQAIRIWLVAAPIASSTEGADKQPRSQLVFPNDDGGVMGYANFRARFWVPLMNACGLVTDEPADTHIRSFTKAQAEFKAPLFGPHMLRHVFASLQIAQGVSPKRLQKMIGHSTLKQTMDVYGHLWPDEDADRERARGVENMV